jgi:hypothetical protein
VVPTSPADGERAVRSSAGATTGSVSVESRRETVVDLAARLPYISDLEDLRGAMRPLELAKLSPCDAR